MDKLSELLQEAKPLYFKRKKQKEIIKKSLFLFVPVIFCSLAILPFTINNSVNYEYNYYTSSTSIIEQMGFETDDYGLLKVD